MKAYLHGHGHRKPEHTKYPLILVKQIINIINNSNYCQHLGNSGNCARVFPLLKLFNARTAMKYTSIILFLFLSSFAFAQQGTIQGVLIDPKTGDQLEGAYVLIPEINAGGVTDLQGAFTLNVAPGTYTLDISYVGYQGIKIPGVVVIENDVTMLKNLEMLEATEDNVLGPVVLSFKKVRSTEVAVLNVRQKSTIMMDGISADKIKSVGDATALDAAKRITGVSVEDGKYVYVRGLSDRYIKTTMNNVEIPGLDPDKNVIQMDIFPASLIGQLMVGKNTTAELPADFTGGVVNIETIDFPDKELFKVSIGGGYNPSMHFKANYLGYQGGSLDFLGMDDGTRALPTGADGANIPTPVSGATPAAVNSFVGSFNPQLGAQTKRSFMDFSGSISYGNQIEVNRKKAKSIDGSYSIPKLGYIFSLTYKSDTKFYDDVTFGEYQKHIEENNPELRYANLQQGSIGEQNVLVGLLGGLAYKTQNTMLRLNVMRLQSGESRTGKFNLLNNGEAVGQSGYFAVSDNLEYNQRALTNVLLSGSHALPKKSGWNVSWCVSPTLSTSDDPDIRKTAFTYSPVDTSFVAGAGGNPTRIWRSLTEISNNSKLDFENTYKILGRNSKLKFGFSHLYKQRSYEILFFDIQFFGQQSWNNADANKVLNASNIFPSSTNNIYYQSGNNNPNPNAYTSNIHNTSAYVSNEFLLTQKMKAIVGFRAENYVQRHTGRDQRYASGDVLNGNNLKNDKVLETLDLFPSLNLIYNHTDDKMFRFSYGKSIARPSFKELSYAQILDPISNRIFNGSLFQYKNWDGKLTESRIDNIDLRFENYMESGQLFSISLFYKSFQNPIELVRIPEQQTSTEYQPRNVGYGSLIGTEIELRKSLNFISRGQAKYNFNTNITLVESRIAMTEAEFNNRLGYKKEGIEISKTRAMAGQAPYVINAGFTLDHEKQNISAGLFYNVKGPTLYIVGAGIFPDIYNEPFHSLNFSFGKKFGKEGNTSFDFKISNILNDKVEILYQSFNAKSQIFSSLNPGRTVSVGFNHSF
ncbi:MAG: hypothetical protein ACI9NN_001074 [Bacteroidia bacterium]|jgi:hypothetical protein